MTQHKGVRLPAAMWEPVNECKSVLVCLPYQGLRALLALSERLEWKTTWIDQSGKQQDLTDLQWALVDATIGGLNCPMCMDDLLAALTGIKDAIENQELSLDVNALVAAVNGVQTAIEQQEMTVNVDLDLASLVTAINGVQTAIEEQEISIGDLTLDLSDIVTVLTTIRSSLDNQTNEMVSRLFELRIGLSDHLAIINQTLESLEMGEVNVDLSGLEAALTAIRTAIEGLSEEEMAIINNVCCGGCGGCGCGGGGQTPPIPPPDLPPDDLLPMPPIPPYDPPPVTRNYQQFACNYAHLHVYAFRIMTLQFAELVAVGELNYNKAREVWEFYFVGLLSYVGSVVWHWVYNLVTWFTSYVTSGAANRMIGAIDANYENLVCALYSGDGAEAKRANFLGVIDGMGLTWAERYWLKLLTQNFEWHQFYREDWQTFEFPATHQQPRQCCGMDGSLPVPLDYGDLYLWPVKFTGYTSVTNDGATTLNVSYTGNRINLVHNGGNNVYRPRATYLWDQSEIVDDTIVGVLYVVEKSVTNGANRRVNFTTAANSIYRRDFSGYDLNTPCLRIYMYDNVPTLVNASAIPAWVTANNGIIEEAPAAGNNGMAFNMESIGDNTGYPAGDYRVALWLLVKRNP